jgi:hypothetical protein
MLLGEPFDEKPGPPSLAMADLNIDAFARKIGRFVGRVDAHVEIRVRIKETAEARQQPFVDRLGVTRTMRDLDDRYPRTFCVASAIRSMLSLIISK